MTRNAWRTEKCATHEHPAPTAEEQARLVLLLSNAINALNEAFAYANRTPSYHDLTDHLTEPLHLLVGLARTL